MKATGIARRMDDLGRIVIPKEIRRTLKIREGDPLLTTLTPIDKFCMEIHSILQEKAAGVNFAPAALLCYDSVLAKTNCSSAD